MEHQDKEERGRGPYALVSVVFYALLVIVAYLLAYLWDIDPLEYYRLPLFPALENGFCQVIFALSIGLGIVAVSKLLDAKVEAFRRLSSEFRKLLGNISIPSAFVIALASSIGEEIFFRGFLQQTFEIVTFADYSSAPILALLAASLVFGFLHQGGEWKVFYPWTLFALVVGLIMGGAYLVTGSLLAPIVIHFTVNFLNLSALSVEKLGSSDDSSQGEEDESDRF